MIPYTQSERKTLIRKFVQHHKAFILNNIWRTMEMLRYATPGFRTVFQNVPYLLQVNRPETKGYLQNDRPALGLYGFERSGFARIFRETYPDRSIREILVRRPAIQALLLIGSTGSIGHTQSSDLDYWVCVDQSTLSRADLDFLKNKLALVAEWAKHEHGVDVHFFLMTLDEIRNNVLGGLDEDSSGDVMPLLLKEEFYRTLLHVAGRMPLWWIVPLGTEKGDYDRLTEAVEQFETAGFHAPDFVDLGFPERPGPKEYLGAAMWQAHKALKDPFKAVLKMMIILEQVESRFQTPLLCDQVKEAVINATPDQLPVDPYLSTIRRVLAFARDDLELIRISAWYKMHHPFDPIRPAPDGPKARIMSELSREWGWKPDKVEDLFNYSRWPDRRKLALGEKIKALLLELYSRIAAKLRADFRDQVMIQDKSLAILNAEIMARFADHAIKVEDLPSEFHRLGLPGDFNLAQAYGSWRLYSSLRSESDYVYSADRISRVAAWLIHNRLWSPNLRIRLRPGPSAVKMGVLLALLDLLSQTFPPRDFSFERAGSLLARPMGPKVLVLNMEEAPGQTRLVSAEVIYRTNLGEMCHEVLAVEPGGEADKYTRLAETMARMDETGLDLVTIFTPPGRISHELESNLRTVFRHFRPERGPAGPSRTKLDTD
ncbi:MAG: class I adenylate cyclase [Thermodesulfobacteriota bacterium]